jgi:twitching motility protein PilJ
VSTTSGGVGGGRTNTVLFLVLGILFVFAIIDFAWLYYQNVQDRKAVAYTTQIQVSSQQLAKYASEAASGNELAFQELKSTSDNIEAYVTALSKGDKTGMPSYAVTVTPDVANLAKAWEQLQGDAKKIIDNQAVVLTANTNAKDFIDKVSALN